jgi:hypothetical protein
MNGVCACFERGFNEKVDIEKWVGRSTLDKT